MGRLTQKDLFLDTDADVLIIPDTSDFSSLYQTTILRKFL